MRISFSLHMPHLELVPCWCCQVDRGGYFSKMLAFASLTSFSFLLLPYLRQSHSLIHFSKLVIQKPAWIFFVFLSDYLVLEIHHLMVVIFLFFLSFFLLDLLLFLISFLFPDNWLFILTTRLDCGNLGMSIFLFLLILAIYLFHFF